MPARAQYAWFLIFLAILGARGVETFRAAQKRVAEVELEPDPREFYFAGTDLVLDSALVLLDRGSVDEALLVAASTPLAPGQEIDLRLSFHAADVRTGSRFRTFGNHGTWGSRRISARNTFAENRHLPPSWDQPRVVLDVTGSHVTEVEGLHALPLVLRYDVTVYGPAGGGRHAGPEDANLLLPTGGVAALRKFDGNYLLLVGIRPHDEPFEAHRLAAWRTRILDSLDLAMPTETAFADAFAEAPRDVRFRSWHRVDPALELAVAGVALVDGELCDRAAVELTGSPDELRARVARASTDSERAQHTRTGESPFEMAALAALSTCGVIPFEDLVEEPAADWLVEHESPLRTIAVAEDPALLAAVVDPHIGSRVGNDLHRYQHGALSNPTLGRTEVARAEWDRLREAWLARGGVSLRLVGRGGVAAAAGLFLPWLLALALVLLPSRWKRNTEPRLSRTAVLGLLLLSAFTLGDLELLVFATPFWWWLGRRWLVSGRRPLFDRILVFLLVGATGQILGYRLGVTAIWGVLTDWTAAAQALGFFFLGRVFLAQERVWDVRAWTTVLAVVVLSWPAYEAGWPGPILLLALLIALAIFFRSSRGGPALRALPA